MRFNLTTDSGVVSQRSFPVSPSVILYFMAGVFLIMAVIFHFVAGSVSREADLLAAEGMEAEATITDHRITETRREKRDSDGFSRTETDIDYYLTLDFVTADGTAMTLEKSVGNTQFNQLQVGSKLTIRYAKSDPTVTEFEKGGRAGEASIFKWVSWGLGAVGLILGGVGVALRRKQAA